MKALSRLMVVMGAAACFGACTHRRGHYPANATTDDNDNYGQTYDHHERACPASHLHHNNRGYTRAVIWQPAPRLNKIKADLRNAYVSQVRNKFATCSAGLSSQTRTRAEINSVPAEGEEPFPLPFLAWAEQQVFTMPSSARPLGSCPCLSGWP